MASQLKRPIGSAISRSNARPRTRSAERTFVCFFVKDQPYSAEASNPYDHTDSKRGEEGVGPSH